jgi:hypothetical protein
MDIARLDFILRVAPDRDCRHWILARRQASIDALPVIGGRDLE